MDYRTATFERLGGGETVEYRTAEPTPHTLAYFDRQGDLYAVQVFDPFTGRTRYYAPRKQVRAQGILYRHLESLGYKNRID
jgi:hypothetical protein